VTATDRLSPTRPRRPRRTAVAAARVDERQPAAFDRLRRYSRGHDLLLGEVARRVITERGFARPVLALPVR
jgi:hypothetical protein